MSTSSITITFQIEVDREIGPVVMEAIGNLALAMQVQSEDGLFLNDEDGEPLDLVARINAIDYTVTHNR